MTLFPMLVRKSRDTSNCQCSHADALVMAVAPLASAAQQLLQQRDARQISQL